MLSPQGLHRRAALFKAIRLFFDGQGFLEVDTPLRLPSVAPEAYVEPMESGNCFLQTSPELCMKRLLAGGNPKLFQLCKCFRKNERGPLHLGEFTMLEWYRTDSDYHQLMADCEDLLAFLTDRLHKSTDTCSSPPAIRFNDHTINLQKPWERLTVTNAFARYGSLSLAEAMAGDTFEEIFCKEIEPRLGLERPTLLHDYPAAMGALARLKPGTPSVAERFELYIGGLELANGFSELTDDEEQRRRFKKERELIRKQGREPGPLPEKFLESLALLKSAAGIALGLDRLAMLFLGVGTIDAAVTFVPEEL